MGAGVKPKIGGLWLGPSWSPSRGILLPVGEDDLEPLAEAEVTGWGWEGRTLTVPRRAGEVSLLLTESEYLAAALHLREQYARRPMWMVFDEAKAERAFLARWPLRNRGSMRFEQDSNHRRITIPYEEYEPFVDELGQRP